VNEFTPSGRLLNAANVIVWAPLVTLKLCVPATRAALAGKTAFASEEVIPTASVTVVTGFQLASTALTVTLTARPDVAVALIAKGTVPKFRLSSAPKLIVCGAPAIVIAKVCVAFGGTLLLAVNIPAKVPTALGVPLISPLAPLSESPVGSVEGVAENAGAGDPFAVSLKLYAEPIVPPGGGPLANVGDCCPPPVLVSANKAVADPALAVTENDPLVPLAVNVGAVATPAPFDMT
jgi:hypothetical protein